MFIGNENEKPDSKYLSEKEIALKELRKSFLEISDRFRFEVIKCQLNAYESISDYKKVFTDYQNIWYSINYLWITLIHI